MALAVLAGFLVMLVGSYPGNSSKRRNTRECSVKKLGE